MRVVVVVVMAFAMMVIGRTGRMITLSTARFAVVAAAALAQDDTAGDIDGQAGQLLAQGHWLAQIGEVI
jgi:hypothetical protein